MRHSWDEEYISGIEREHRELVTAYHNEPALKSAIDAYTRVDIKSFDTAWEVVDVARVGSGMMCMYIVLPVDSGWRCPPYIHVTIRFRLSPNS